VVGLGNPGQQYAATRHNIGFEIAEALSRRWELPKIRGKFNGLIAEGRAGAGGPRVVVLLPQTYMNKAGNSVGPARGSLKVPLERIVVLHDEIDLPFGEVRTKLGGGVAGHNGVRSLRDGLGSADFWRVRAGVGRPDSTDPEVVSNYVLSKFRESPDQVRELIEGAAGEAEKLVEGIATGTVDAEQAS
jgi:peptidyl-tRNA hydrolase, PTH1 family